MEDKKTYFNSEVVQTESKSTISDKTVVDKIRTPYLPFGTDNLFPQGMALLGRRAAIHRAIISNKVTYTIGKGFVKPKNRNLRKYIRSVNANGQSLESLCSMLFHDHWSQGNVYLELITDKNGNFLNMHHRDATTARRSVDGTYVLFHPKWSVWAANKMHTEDIPLYPNFAQKGEFYHSVYHFKKYEPEFPNYGLPTWVAGLDAAGIAYKTNRWNLSRLNNSFKPSGILDINADISIEEAADLKKSIKDDLSGEENAGGLLTITRNGGEGSNTSFIPLLQTTDGEWIELHSQSESELITAHNWYRSLMSVKDNTGFDTRRIRSEYEIAKNTVIQEAQKFFLDVIIDLIEEFEGIPAEELRILNEAPVSMIDLVDVNACMTINEARKDILGLDELDDPERGNRFIREEINMQTVEDNQGTVNAQEDVQGSNNG